MYVVLILLFWNTACATHKVTYAWWVDAQFDTTCSQTMSNVILWNEKCIKLLTEDDLKAVPHYAVDMREVSAVLRTSFRNADSSEVSYYFVGVFRERNGATGRALVISSDTNFKRIERVIFVHGKAGFSALIKQRRQLLWAFCLQCGDYEVVAQRK
jgi:hypothetical protein